MGRPFPYEDFVQSSVEEHLKKKGYIIVPRSRRRTKTRGPGIDIQAYKKTKSGNYNSSYSIECKGVTKSIYVTTNEAFGQILKRMKNRVWAPQVYVVAFPDTVKMKNELKKIKPGIFRILSKHLNLKVWIVDKYGNVSKYKQ